MSTLIRRNNGMVLVFDTAESVVKEANSRTTDHPIETGSSITDHVVTNPRAVQVIAVVSDAAFVSRAEDSFPLGPGRAAAVVQAMEQMRNNREIFILETRNEVFSNMVLTEFRVPRDAETGDASRIQFTAREITLVERRFISIPRATEETADAAAEDLNTGKQPTTPVDQSALIQFIDFATTAKDEMGQP